MEREHSPNTSSKSESGWKFQPLLSPQKTSGLLGVVGCGQKPLEAGEDLMSPGFGITGVSSLKEKTSWR